MGRMTGKVAVITGANSGVGKATTILFAKEGATIVATDRRIETLETVAEQIRSEGGKITCLETDISDSSAVKALIETAVNEYGKIDAMVNCAGVLEPGLRPIEKIVDEDLDFVLNVNTKGTMYCIREACLAMEKQDTLASIVNVSSVAGVTGGSCAAYTASKAAINGVTKNAAMRYAGTNIRINTICPGGIATPMMSDPNYQSDPDMMNAICKHCDLSLPFSLPEEIADILLFLSCDESKVINGQVIVCDKGCNL